MLRTLAVLVLATLLLSYLPHLPSLQNKWGLHCTHERPTNNGTIYPGDTDLIWNSCGDINGRKLECSTLDVPMDQFNTTNSHDKTFTLPLIRLRGDADAKNILVNPGGPGGSGMEFIYRNGEDLGTIIGSGHHIVSFDPRGVNGSTPQADCYPDKETRQSLSNVRASRPVEDSIEAYAWSQNFVKACRDTLGEHGKYINTPQTAADMNSILDALGQNEMIFWGFSYGTVLGQTYASLFPERSHRVIIDGVVNNFLWFNKTSVQDESLIDSERVLYGFFDECVKAGESCPLSSFGKDAEEIQNKVIDLIGSLEENLPVYVNNTRWGLLKPENVLINGLFLALYKPATWWVLADRLARLLQGNATEAYLAWGGKEPWSTLTADDSNTVVESNDGLSGQNYWPNGREAFLNYTLPYFNSSIFASGASKGIYIKQQWLVEKSHAFKQQPSVETVHPILILSTTYDPVCPLVSAKSALSAFKGSQIVELEGYGHCSLAMPSNCVAKHVRAFLYNGTVPEHYSKCNVDGPYFIKPDASNSSSEAPEFKNSHDQAIYHAQLHIAQDDSWPYTW